MAVITVPIQWLDDKGLTVMEIVVVLMMVVTGKGIAGVPAMPGSKW